MAMTKMEKLREVNQTLGELLIELETGIFVGSGKNAPKREPVKTKKSSNYK